MNPRDRTSYDVWRRNKRNGNQHRGQQPRSRNNNNEIIIIRQQRILCTRLASRADPVSPISPHSRESGYWSSSSPAGESNQVEAVSGALLNAECARALPSIHSCRARFPPASVNVADSSLNEAEATGFTEPGSGCRRLWGIPFIRPFNTSGREAEVHLVWNRNHERV